MGGGHEVQRVRGDIFEDRGVTPRHCWTIVWGQEWKILFLLGLKIAQGGKVRNLTLQASSLARCSY